MRSLLRRPLLEAALSIGSLALAAPLHAQVVRSGAGLGGATAARDQFRVDLGGGTVAGAAGLFGGVRREINWDAVPDARSAPNPLPLDFFNVNSPRGAVFSTAGTGVAVSADASNPTASPINFGDIDPSYTGTFAQFSPERLFTPIGSNVVDVTFFVAGTTTPGATRGFGSIFTDVDLPGTTSIEFFDLLGHSLGTFFAPNVPGAAGTFSFLGVSYATPTIGRVRITNGNAALGAGVLDANGNPTDLVVMDDFVYGEPVAASAVPEPGTVTLLAGGLAALAAAARRRRGGARG